MQCIHAKNTYADTDGVFHSRMSKISCRIRLITVFRVKFISRITALTLGNVKRPAMCEPCTVSAMLRKALASPQATVTSKFGFECCGRGILILRGTYVRSASLSLFQKSVNRNRMAPRFRLENAWVDNRRGSVASYVLAGRRRAKLTTTRPAKSSLSR